MIINDAFRRFGFWPDLKLNEKFEARSLLTPIPTSTANPRQDDIDFQWEFEQSFQAICFLYFTSKEVREAYVIRLLSNVNAE